VRKTASFLTRLAGITSMAGLSVIAFLTTLDVALRWLFNAPIEGQADVTETLLPIIIAATFVAAAWGRPHIGIRLAGGVLGRRAGRFFDSVADLSLAAFFGVIVWQFWRYSGELAAEGRQSWVLAIKLAPFWYATTGILALTTLLQVYNAVSYAPREAAVAAERKTA
jgi:TRAP-type C4-dicarboxylate transport system permease small subunit